MKVLLIRDSRIKHKAGEVVEASPEEAFFLLSVGSAVKAPVKEKQKRKNAK